MADSAAVATILVVDDEFGIAELFSAILGDEGHRVLTATNGKHGLEVLAGERADLIYLDHMMPVMNGLAMLGRIAADPALRHIPVVLMSAMPEPAVIERASGYASFVRKPFRVAQIVTLTKRLLAPAPKPAR